MSAICGILNRFGEPVKPESITTMISSLAHRAKDGSDFLIKDCIALGQLKHCITPESLNEPLPYHHSEVNVIITGDIRLDNREELFCALGISSIYQGEPDSQLIIRAYKKWGIDMVEKLLGEYALALWDMEQKALFLITDHAGTRPLYFYQDFKYFIFATEIKAIRGCSLVPTKLDNEALALQLALPMIMHVRPENTLFTNIKGMCAAHFLKVRTNSIEEHHYWKPDITKRIKFKNEDEWREAFQELFFRSVQARLRSAFPVTALLSGGLDSSSIVAVAAKLLKKQGKRLTTLSVIAPDDLDGIVADERDFIAEFKIFDNIDMHFVTDKQMGPFSNLEELVHIGDSPFTTSRHFLYSAFALAAKKIGSRVILDGIMGEYGPTFHGDGCLAELLQRGRCFNVLRELFYLSKVEKRSVRSLIKQHLIKPYLPVAVESYFKKMMGSRISYIKEEFINEWLKKDLFKTYRIELNNFFSTHRDHRKNQAAIYLRKRACRPTNQFVGSHDVVMSFPFANPRIIDFCLASPETIKVRYGYRRYMIRAAMKDILPPAIRLRTSKMPFSPDYSFRYNVQKGSIKKLFSEIPANDPINEIINVEKLCSVLDLPTIRNRHKTHTRIELLDIPPIVFLYYFYRQYVE